MRSDIQDGTNCGISFVAQKQGMGMKSYLVLTNGEQKIISSFNVEDQYNILAKKHFNLSKMTVKDETFKTKKNPSASLATIFQDIPNKFEYKVKHSKNHTALFSVASFQLAKPRSCNTFQVKNKKKNERVKISFITVALQK